MNPQSTLSAELERNKWLQIENNRLTLELEALRKNIKTVSPELIEETQQLEETNQALKSIMTISFYDKSVPAETTSSSSTIAVSSVHAEVTSDNTLYFVFNGDDEIRLPVMSNIQLTEHSTLSDVWIARRTPSNEPLICSSTIITMKYDHDEGTNKLYALGSISSEDKTVIKTNDGLNFKNITIDVTLN